MNENFRLREAMNEMRFIPYFIVFYVSWETDVWNHRWLYYLYDEMVCLR